MCARSSTAPGFVTGSHFGERRSTPRGSIFKRFIAAFRDMYSSCVVVIDDGGVVKVDVLIDLMDSET